MKTCTKCKVEKEESEFNKRNKYKDKLDVWCRKCYKEYCYKNRDRINSNKKKLCDENPEKYRKKQKDYYIKNMDKVKKNKQRYYLENKDKINKYTIENYKKPETKEKCRENQKKRYYNDALFNFKRRITALIYQSLKYNKYPKTSTTASLLGISYEDFIIYLGPKPEGNYHLDHICPCSQAQNKEELIKLQHYTNFRWLSAQENLSKGDTKTLEAESKCKELLGRDWI